MPKTKLTAYALTLSVAGACLFACEARDSIGTSAQALSKSGAADAGNATTIGDFVLYAQRSVSVADHAQVSGGEVGVRFPVATSFTGSQLSIGDFTHVDAAYTLMAPSVSLGNNAQVGDVDTDNLQNSGADKLGQVGAFPVTAMPPMPLAMPPSPSGADVTLGNHKDLALPPGAYGALTIADHCRVTLAAGSYTFSSISIDQHSYLLGDPAGVTVAVGGSLSLASFSYLMPSSGAAGLLSISVAGADGAAPAVSVAAHANVTALLAAPNGTVSIADHAQVEGAFAGFDVAVGSHSQVSFQSGFPATSVHGTQQLTGYFGNQPDGSFPIVGPVPPDTEISLSVGLPVQDPDGLKNFIKGTQDKTNLTTYRKYLSVDVFRMKYGALDSDYGKLKDWANGAGFTVASPYANNLLLTVTGTAAQIETALYINLVYRQTWTGTAPVNFIAVDREPSLNLQPTVLWIAGFTDYQIPHSAACNANPASGAGATFVTMNNTGYMAADLRNAYLGVGSFCQTQVPPLDGTGQTVGILALEPFNGPDVTGYIQGQTTNIPMGNVSIVNVSSTGMSQNGESTLDLDMVMAMAPQAKIVVFQGNVGITGHADDILHRMATDGRLTVATNSYTFGRSDNQAQALSEMAAEGITFFTASGDFGNIGDPQDVRDLDNQTLVGGTVLQTNVVTPGPGGTFIYPMNYWNSETTWNLCSPALTLGTRGVTGTMQLIPGYGNQANDITSGGIMNGVALQMCQCFPQPFCCGTGVPIPGYQDPSLMTPISMGGNGGSTLSRNYPDVSAAAFDVENFWQGQFQAFGGTSAAAPLWAGFVALANQYSSRTGEGQVGAFNPVLYAIGATRGSGANDVYKTSFNDIADGLTNSDSSGIQGFPSVAGYDLATGWGSPQCGLIQELGTHHAETPSTYDTILIHLDNGNDGVNDQSGITMDIQYNKPSIPTSTFVLKQGGESGWSTDGTEQDIQKHMSDATQGSTAPIDPSTVSGVVLHILENGQGGLNGDNWDVGGIQVRLAAIRSPYTCLVDLSGNGGCDASQPSCMNGKLGNTNDTGVLRLSSSDDTGAGPGPASGQGPDAFFDMDPSGVTPGGCPKWGGIANTEPFTKLEFNFDTSDDNLDNNSEVDVDIFDTAGNKEHGVLHGGGGGEWANNTQHTVTYTVVNTALDLQAIDHMVLTFNAACTTDVLGACLAHDQWHMQSVEVFAYKDATPWARTCYFRGFQNGTTFDILGNGHPQPEVVFKQDNSSQTLVKSSGCL